MKTLKLLFVFWQLPGFRQPRSTYCLTLIFFSMIMAISAAPARAEQTGKVSYPALGIEFQIPQGWIGQESGDGFLMGSTTETGLITLGTHAHRDLSALKQEAVQGITNEGGLTLQKSGEFIELGSNAVAAEFSGIVDGQSARAFIAGVINPHGQGVSIMALTTTEAYSDRYRQRVTEIVKSLQFSKLVEVPVVAEWRQSLSGSRLTYLDSYRSSGPSVGGYMTGGGYSSETKIILCVDGSFADSSKSSMSVDTGGAFGSSSGANQGNGNWSVEANASGGASLRLSYSDGSIAEYALEYRNNKTYLNGTRYFRTSDAGC